MCPSRRTPCQGPKGQRTERAPHRHLRQAAWVPGSLGKGAPPCGAQCAQGGSSGWLSRQTSPAMPGAHSRPGV